jgi:hypothetical protein
MDPTQCLIDILNSIDGCHGQDSQEAKARHREEAIEGLQNLAGWLQKGGFAPKLQEVLRLTRDHWADVELAEAPAPPPRLLDSLWRVAYSAGGGLTIRPLTETGEEKNGKSSHKVEPHDLIEVDL